LSVLLEARGVAKTYTMSAKSISVLSSASLTVSEGEAVAVIGKSGAGKSTLLHILGALDHPDAGQVVIGGQDVYACSNRRRESIRSETLGFVFQSYHLLPELDVLENVMLPAMARRGYLRGLRGWRARAEELLECVGLKDRAGHTPLELSGGEQQRVALARALMNDPQIVLADEPTGNLDSATGKRVLDYLFTLTRDRGHALVIVTHNEGVADSCDSVLHLTDGAIRAA
jgi:ABC-type lipoprotein export system ATPase subunit